MPSSRSANGFIARLWRWFIRTFFRLLYGPCAWAYDAVAWLVSFGQWNAWGRVALRRLRGPIVLELGHGPGHLTAVMAQRGLRPIALDLSPQMGRLARRRLRRADLPVRLVRARAQALPFRDGSFPDLVATFPTEYIVDPRTLREVRRVLSRDGRLVVVAAALLTGKGLPSRLLEWLYRITGQRGPLPRGDERFWSELDLELEVERVQMGRSRVMLVVATPATPVTPRDRTGYTAGRSGSAHSARERVGEG